MWAAIINTLVGLWLMIASGLLDFERRAANNNYILGPLEITFAIAAIWEVNRSARYINIGIGIWLAAAPFILSFDSPAATWNSIVSGILITALSMAGGKIKGKYGGGWKALFQKDPAHIQAMHGQSDA